MYKHITKAKFIMIIIAFLLSIPATLSSTARATSAENGEWIGYPFVYPTTGSVFAVCGEDCVGFAKEVSDLILFFDINKSAWTELKFETVKVIRDMKAKGHTVFAYTDEFLIGYSSFTCSHDVIPYEGVLLNTIYGRAYYCGRNLALFVTNETMYVFDSKLGRWQEYDYVLSVGYSGSAYVVRDDYVFFRWSSADKPPKIVVYSLHTHSFNQLEDSGYYPGSYNRWGFEMLDHGFAGFYEREAENFVLVGYSAYTNEFSLITVSGLGAQFATGAGSDLQEGEHTAYAISFKQDLLPSEIRGHFYGYDTCLGSWSYTTVSFIVGEERWSQYWMPGGRFLVDHAVMTGEVYKLIIYSGITGQWSVVIEPGLTYNSVTSFILCGGEVLVVYDVDNAWGHSFSTGQSSMISIDKPKTGFFPEGKDFCVFNRFSDSDVQMTMYIYNSRTNQWTIIEGLTKATSPAYSTGERVFAYRSDTSPTRETVFYSSFLDAYEKCEFPVDSSVSINVKYSLAWARSSNRSYIFDAQRGGTSICI